MIYIRGVFSIIQEQLLHIAYMFFVNDLGFLIADWSISKITKTVEKMGQITME